MNKLLYRIFWVSVLGFSTFATANTEEDLLRLLDLHRQVIFLTTTQADNEVASQQIIFIARNFYAGKQTILDSLQDQIINDPTAASNIVDHLILFSQSSETRAADALVFIDLVDFILYQQAERPFLKTDQLSFLRQLEQRIELIQGTYKQELSEIYSAMATRGFDLEPWADYLEFLHQKYSLNDIVERFNKGESILAEPVTRGAEAKADFAPLVWGFGVPEKTVVLTFDDGPHHRNTEAILDILKEHDAKAYFFNIGKNMGSVVDGEAVLSSRASIARRALEEGHQLANHTYSHPILTKLDEETQIKELTDANIIIKALTGQDTTEYRPPYGSKNDALISVSQNMGMRAIMWNVDSLDWADPVPESIVERVMQDLANKKKGILLFHDIHKQTVQALPSLLTKLKEEGYKIVTIDGQDFPSSMETTATNEAAPELTTTVKSQLYSESWAVVIGVNQYKYWPKLSYAVNDAQGVASILQTQYGFKKDNIFELFDEDASRERITELLTGTLADPAKVKPNDRVFIFFAGHGMTRMLPSGRNLGYIIPYEAELNNFASKSISMTHLQDFSDMIPAKHVYFVMDSCYSGIALTRGAGISQGSNYLSEIASRRARQILTAGGADQEVADGGPQGHSIFTWNLLQGLSGKADLDNNGIITATELAAYISPRVSESSNQTPAFGNLVGSEGGEFIFELAVVHNTQDLTEEEKLKRQLNELQRENANLRQQLATLQSATLSSAAVRGSATEISTLSPVQRKLKANEHHEIGLKHYRERNYPDALSNLRLAITYNPANTAIVNDYGFVLYRDGQYANALAWLEKTIEMDADRIPVYLNIADTLVELERKQEAVPYYEYYLERYPNSPVRDRIDVFLADTI